MIRDKTEKFIPTNEEWGKYYSDWLEKLVKSLWKCGSESECREAVHEAFLKVMGLSDHLAIRQTLTPKKEGCWYGFIRCQARGVLSNYHRYSGRFDLMVDDSDQFVYVADFDEKEQESLRKEFRQAVRELCLKAGISERNRLAFEMFVLDGVSGEEVVLAVPGILNTNNLYQIKKRVMDVLKESADELEDRFGDLKAA